MLPQTLTALPLALMAGALLLNALPAQADTASPPEIPIVQAHGGLPHVFAKLRAGKPVTIVWFGGSITAGAGASQAEETSYRGRVGHWFQTTFPQAKVTNINAAIGGTGSDLGAFRTWRDVLAHEPDLVFVEYAVNDGSSPPDMLCSAMRLSPRIIISRPSTWPCLPPES